MDNWQPKNFTVPASSVDVVIPEATDLTVTVNTGNVISKMPNTIFGNNSNTWIGRQSTYLCFH